MPAGVAEDRLRGGLDLAATLAAGRPIAESGLLAQAVGGVLLVPSAERLSETVAAILAAALNGDGVPGPKEQATETPFAAVLLDEGVGDERAPGMLGERVAFVIDLDGPGWASVPVRPGPRPAAAGCRHVDIGNEALEAICAAALAFGVPSLRTAQFALRAAKAAAAIAGRDAVAAEDIALAAALVIAPRATRLPAEAAADEPSPEDDEPTAEAEGEASQDDATATGVAPQDDAPVEPLTDRVVEAARAAIPAGLLAALNLSAIGNGRTPGGGAGAPKRHAARGRPAGTRRGSLGDGARLALVETLRAAAPWQRLRRQALPNGTPSGPVLVRRDDFRLARYKARSEAVTIFVVDASGSAALHRLAEVKGAVELVLAECYVRRDQVALIAFRGTAAELVLPPTRSLARAKRALAGQAGGGGTPLASAIDAATRLAEGIRRKGQAALVVMMTDGKANIDRQGRPGRAMAEADAAIAARALHGSGTACLVLDIAPRPAEPAQRLAATMGARYMPLPYADARVLSQAVIAAGPNR